MAKQRRKKQKEDRDLTRARAAVLGPSAQHALNITYEEWKARRLERSSSRCGGCPTFIGSRIQPCDVARLNVRWADDIRVAADWRVNAQDIEHSKRFCAEEPRWQILGSGYDHLQGRDLSDDEYEDLRAKWRLA
jgi:uncharacterized protein (DUF433 family)